MHHSIIISQRSELGSSLCSSVANLVQDSAASTLLPCCNGVLKHHGLMRPSSCSWQGLPLTLMQTLSW